MVAEQRSLNGQHRKPPPWPVSRLIICCFGWAYNTGKYQAGQFRKWNLHCRDDSNFRNFSRDCHVSCEQKPWLLSSEW